MRRGARLPASRRRACRRGPWRSPRDRPEIAGDCPEMHPETSRTSPDHPRSRSFGDRPRSAGDCPRSAGGARVGGLGGAVRGCGGGGEATDARRGSRRRGPHPAGLEAGTAGPLLLARVFFTARVSLFRPSFRPGRQEGLLKVKRFYSGVCKVIGQARGQMLESWCVASLGP